MLWRNLGQSKSMCAKRRRRRGRRSTLCFGGRLLSISIFVIYIYLCIFCSLCFCFDDIRAFIQWNWERYTHTCICVYMYMCVCMKWQVAHSLLSSRFYAVFIVVRGHNGCACVCVCVYLLCMLPAFVWFLWLPPRFPCFPSCCPCLVVFFANLLIRTLIASLLASCDKQHNKSDIQRTPQNIVVSVVVLLQCTYTYMPFGNWLEQGISAHTHNLAYSFCFFFFLSKIFSALCTHSRLELFRFL